MSITGRLTRLRTKNAVVLAIRQLPLRTNYASDFKFSCKLRPDSTKFTAGRLYQLLAGIDGKNVIITPPPWLVIDGQAKPKENNGGRGDSNDLQRPPRYNQTFKEAPSQCIITTRVSPVDLVFIIRPSFVSTVYTYAFHNSSQTYKIVLENIFHFLTKILKNAWRPWLSSTS